MGIRTGVTLVVGGGFHGKTTLLKALEAGVYNKALLQSIAHLQCFLHGCAINISASVSSLLCQLAQLDSLITRVGHCRVTHFVML